ncbi:MAG: restriction endonuclease subunit S [Gammaproteobacteria bacterium]|nr:restriction endonuclease subunit S [Gammaproteobacteria bacterium]
MQTYNEYKPSGVQWLGDIPKDWVVKRLKYTIHSLKVGPFGSAIKTSDYTDSGYWVYNQRTVLDDNFLSNNTLISEHKYNELKSFNVKTDDILITTRGTIGQIAIVPKNNIDGILHPCLMKFRLHKNIASYDYIRLCFNETSLIYKQFQFKSNATTIPVIYSDTLKELSIPLPPLSEQQQIVTFLDNKLVTIDTLIGKQRQLLEKLDEQRSALISHTVTKGLNPQTPMKDSGVEWLGDIPSHWEVKRLKYVANIFNGDSLNEDMKAKYTSINLDELPYISSKDINVATHNVNYNNGLRIPKNTNLKIAPKNSSLLCIEGGSAGRKVAFINQDVCFVNKLASFVAQIDNSKFLFYILNGELFKNQFNINLSGLIGGVSITSIKHFFIPLPPLTEQQQIADYLDTETAKIDKTKQKITELIAKLTEYRTALITNAVTGKIKVSS